MKSYMVRSYLFHYMMRGANLRNKSKFDIKVEYVQEKPLVLVATTCVTVVVPCYLSRVVSISV